MQFVSNFIQITISPHAKQPIGYAVPFSATITFYTLTGIEADCQYLVCAREHWQVPEWSFWRTGDTVAEC